MTPVHPWPVLLAGKTASHATISAIVLSRLVELIGPALAGHLLPGPNVEIAKVEIAQGRLINRFRRADGLRWARHADRCGIQVVCLKGLAAAHLYYDDADLRTMSDADLLFRARDRDALVAHYRAAGLEFEPSAGRSPWGHISDASTLAMTGPDGGSNVDIHTHPDAWPLHLGLSTAAVFAAAHAVQTSEGEILVPSTTHMLLLSASHVARDLFGPSTAKSLIDAALLLRRQGHQIDWAEFVERMVNGRVARPVRAFFGLLERLGADVTKLPAGLRGYTAGGEFERALDDYVAMFPDDPSLLERARREVLLCAEPAVAMGRNWMRLKGLVRLV
jgi:hypothetical protein